MNVLSLGIVERDDDGNVIGTTVDLNAAASDSDSDMEEVEDDIVGEYPKSIHKVSDLV